MKDVVGPTVIVAALLAAAPVPAAGPGEERPNDWPQYHRTAIIAAISPPTC